MLIDTHLIFDYPALCARRSTNANHALRVAEGFASEIRKGIEGGAVSTRYLREKLEELKGIVSFLEANTDKEEAE